MIFLLWILIKDYLSDSIKDYKMSINLILIFVLIWAVNPIPTYGLIFVNYINPNVSHIPEGCYTNYLMSKDNLEGLREIRNIIEKNNKDFISMTEYSFLYCDYNINPPKNLPLWFDEGISFYNENIQDILETIILEEPKVILVQNAHGHENPNLNDELIESFISSGYKKEIIIEKTVSSSPITVLVKDK